MLFISAISTTSLFLMTPISTANPKCDAIDGDYIVTFAKHVNAKAEMKSAPGRSINPKFEYSQVLNGFSANLSAEQACSFAKRPFIENVELDGAVSIDGAISQSLVGSGLWGLDRIDEASLPSDARFDAANDGSGSTIYIVDTGINANSEFGARYSAVGFNNAKGNSTFTDCNGHGTHVAGTAAGTTYGVAKGANIVAVRVLDCSGSGTWSGVAKGLDWIASAANTNSKRAAVINMSIGGAKNATVDTAVKNIIALGYSVVVAAGNEKGDACKKSPSNVTAAITVAASDSSDTFASFSNYGSCVDLIAPGVGIVSIWGAGTSALNGTSMASPHVAGAVAIYLGANPGRSPAQVASDLVSSASSNKIKSNPVKTPNKLLCIIGCSKQ